MQFRFQVYLAGPPEFLPLCRHRGDHEGFISDVEGCRARNNYGIRGKQFRIVYNGYVDAQTVPGPLFFDGLFLYILAMKDLNEGVKTSF